MRHRSLVLVLVLVLVLATVSRRAFGALARSRSGSPGGGRVRAGFLFGGHGVEPGLQVAPYRRYGILLVEERDRVLKLAAVARKAASNTSKYPGWFGKVWVPIERESRALRWWEPMLVPGLLQTVEYSLALFRAWEPAGSDDDLDALVNGRLERQAILDSDSPPDLRVVLDEPVLHRLIGSPEIMHDQLVHLADMSCRPAVTVQVIPAGLGAHGGLLGAFIVAEPVGSVYLETAVEAQITGDDAVRERAALIFERLTTDALPRGASRELILKVAEGTWNV